MAQQYQAAKSTNNTESDDHSKLVLNSLFRMQGENGILPRYQYDKVNTDADKETEPFIQDSSIPNWKLFRDMMTNARYVPRNYKNTTRQHQQENQTIMMSSGRISGVPLHAGVVLDLYYASEQTSQDLIELERHFEQIYAYHEFLHNIVMRGCHKPYNHSEINRTPCYNVVHPWETLIDKDVSSPLWKLAMEPARRQMREQHWQPPKSTVALSEFDQTSIFLLERLSNATIGNCSTKKNDTGVLIPPLSSASLGYHSIDVECENQILERSPFALLDVGYASILLKSDFALLRIAQLLQKKQRQHNIVDPSRLQTLVQWKEQSEYVVQDLLWNEPRQSYMSKRVVVHNSSSTFELEWMEMPIANNFIALWVSTIRNEQEEEMKNAMISHLLERQGSDSFNCGSYPLWSVGGCDNTTHSLNTYNGTRVIDPVLNYMVATGMRPNGMVGVGRYLANSTLRMTCGLENTVIPPVHHTCDNVTFPFLFETTGRALTGAARCFETSTATAAIVSSLLLKELPIHYVPAPPIRPGWVIVLVVVELSIAVGIGISCLVMSLNLIRRLSRSSGDDSDRDDLVLLLQEEGHFFSATTSLASLEGEGDEDDILEHNDISYSSNAI